MDLSLILLAIIAIQTTYLSARRLIKLRRRNGRYVFVDTSVLIDGRIVSVAESGFIPGILAIPRSVLGELQFLADNGDTDKRTRARHGLDVVSELQELGTVETIIFNDSVRAEEGVDNRLLTLAKRHKGLLCTIDYNLNKVAQAGNLVVLNINELAKTLRMAYLPGEKMLLELTQKGNDGHQAVGHLVDGTMVVVEHAHQLIGKTVEVEFIRSLQTAAGKMMFARPTGDRTTPSQKPKSSRGRQQTEPRVANDTKPADEPKKESRPPKKQQPLRKQHRRRTPEDSMVELANKE